MPSILDGVDQRTQMAGRNRLELLLFRLDSKQRFGINVFKVQEVIQCPKLTHLPKSHHSVLGVAHMRGKTIPVVDLARAIGMPSTSGDEGQFVVITEYNRRVQGFLVQSVDRIVNLGWEAIKSPPKATGHYSYLTAVTEVDNELVEIIDVEKVLADIVAVKMDISAEVTAEAGTDMIGERNVVLVADDSMVARSQVKRTLEQMNIEVVLANDGKLALDKLRSWEKDEPEMIDHRLLMVISDIEMPSMDGYTLTTEIRKNPKFADLYIVLHTSLSGVFNQSLVEKVGANEFIAKFNADELASSVVRQMKRLAA